MPTLRILLPDGTLHESPLPDGMANISPDEVASIVKNSGIPHINDPLPHPAVATPLNPQPSPTTPAPAPTSLFAQTGRAILDTIKSRTVEPAQTLFGSDSTLTQRGLALAQLAGTGLAATNTPGLIALGAGAGVEAAARAAGLPPEIAGVAGGATELTAGVWDMIRSAPRVFAQARKVLQSGEAAVKEGGALAAEAAKEPTFNPQEVFGRLFSDEVRTELRQRRFMLGQQFDELEGAFQRVTPEIMPGTAAYNDLGNLLMYQHDSAMHANGTASRILTRIERAMRPAEGDPQPIKMEDLITLNKELRQMTRSVENPLDPNASENAKKALDMLHILKDDVFQSALPPDVYRRYAAVSDSFVNDVVEPSRFISDMTSYSTSPQQAFEMVFNTNDPHNLRMALRVLQTQPDVVGKMRLGFAQSMSGLLDGTLGPATALTRLKNFKNLLVGSGMYSENDIRAMELLIKEGKLPSLGAELTQEARQLQVLLRGTLGATAATAVASHPATLAALAIGSATGPGMIRRMFMLPEGSQARRNVAALLVRNIARGIRGMMPPPNEAARAAASLPPTAATGAFVQ
jgi:hypothetical protein